MSEDGKGAKGGYVLAQVVMVVAFLVTAFIIAVKVDGDATLKLKLSTGYGLLVLTFLFGMVILVEIIRGNIDLSALLSEPNNGNPGEPMKASMSRFQLLIFTFVIAFSLFMMVVATGKFPEVPPNVLTLLGISASTYAVSKGIQAGSKNGQSPTQGPTAPPATAARPGVQAPVNPGPADGGVG
jgi:hypothetical protein